MRVFFEDDAELYRPEWLEACQIEQGSFEAPKPFHLEFSEREIDAFAELMEELADLSESSVPPMVRIDCVQSTESDTSFNFSVFEVNADTPTGLTYTYALLQAYGYDREARRLRHSYQGLLGQHPTIFYEGMTGVTPYELPIYRDMLGPVQAVDVTNAAAMREADANRNGSGILRACSGEYIDPAYHELFATATNPIGSGVMGDKRLLAHVQRSRIVPSSCVHTVSSTGPVPDGWVYKTSHSFGGKEVFLPGDTVPPGAYLAQEQIHLPTRIFPGHGTRKWGVDVFILGNVDNIFAFGRTCQPEDGILNVCSGGGLMPGIVNSGV